MRPFHVALLFGWLMSPIGVDTFERHDMFDRLTFYVYCNCRWPFDGNAERPSSMLLVLHSL